MLRDLSYNGDYIYASLPDGRVMQLTYEGKVTKVVKTEAKSLDMAKIGVELSGLVCGNEI